MRAIVIEKAGGPEALRIEERPKPAAREGWALIKVMAFGLNRSELFTRQGHSPSVQFPRVLGIECVGLVEAAPGTAFSPGQTVAAMMGGMGRVYDGGYAEYTLIPAEHVFALETGLDWPALGALPEMFQTVNGSLTIGLEVQAGQTLLIRGGTSSIGMTAAALAKQRGLTVAATTRNPENSRALTGNGADHVIIDDGAISGRVRELFPGGAERVLELVGTGTLLDSLQATRPGGIVCMTGMLGGEWTLSDFSPMAAIPTGVRLTTYSGGSSDVTAAELQDYVNAVEAGKIEVKIARVFPFEEIVEAHRFMEESVRAGKIVVEVKHGE